MIQTSTGSAGRPGGGPGRDPGRPLRHGRPARRRFQALPDRLRTGGLARMGGRRMPCDAAKANTCETTPPDREPHRRRSRTPQRRRRPIVTPFRQPASRAPRRSGGRHPGSTRPPHPRRATPHERPGKPRRDPALSKAPRRRERNLRVTYVLRREVLDEPARDQSVIFRRAKPFHNPPVTLQEFSEAGECIGTRGSRRCSVPAQAVASSRVRRSLPGAHAVPPFVVPEPVRHPCHNIRLA